MGASALGVALAVVLVAAPAATGTSLPDSIELASALERRAALGLVADPTETAGLMKSDADVGSDMWGIPMTAAEEGRVDLPGRMQFAVDVAQSVMPALEDLPTLAGAYFDSASNGELVVALTEIEESVAAKIDGLMPASSRGLRIVERQVTDAALSDALKLSAELWARFLPEVPVQSAAVDSVRGELVFEIDARAVEAATDRFGSIASQLGVQSRLIGADPAEDTACTSRDNCAYPMKGGVRLYKGVIDSYNECTMAFHVYLNNFDDQFLTAGHCGYSGSNNWLHPGIAGNNVVGTDQATLYAPEGKDLMRIQMDDAQAWYYVYGDPRWIVGSTYPQVGMPVCASRGRAATISCGTVTSQWVRWYSNTAGYYVWGGDSNLPSIGGDSGSPIYLRYNAQEAFAVGTLSNTSGNFGIVEQALSELGPLWINVPPPCPGIC